MVNGTGKWKVNRTGVPGSPAKRCAGNTVAFESPAFLAWKMKSPGGGPRLESGWWPQAMWIVSTIFLRFRRLELASQTAELHTVESEPAGWQAPSRKRVGG